MKRLWIIVLLLMFMAACVAVPAPPTLSGDDYTLTMVVILKTSVHNSELTGIARTPAPTISPTITNTPSDTPHPVPTWTPRPTATLQPIQPTYTPPPTFTARPTYTVLPTLTVRPTYTPYPTATMYPSSTPRPTATPTGTATIISGRLQRAHPIPTPNADGVAVVDWFEYVCFTENFYGVADGINFWVHDDPIGYAICVGVGHAGAKRKLANETGLKEVKQQ